MCARSNVALVFIPSELKREAPLRVWNLSPVPREHSEKGWLSWRSLVIGGYSRLASVLLCQGFTSTVFSFFLTEC